MTKQASKQSTISANDPQFQQNKYRWKIKTASGLMVVTQPLTRIEAFEQSFEMYGFITSMFKMEK